MPPSREGTHTVPPPSAPQPATKTRVLHFVSGGFSGATQVAISLAQAAREDVEFDTLVVLRRKKQTKPARIDALKESGIRVELISGAFRWLSIWQLWRLCASFRPDVLIAHGYPEHLIGRMAGRFAKVPMLIHVEHNSRERYNWWTQLQSRWLARQTRHIVGVSEGVKTALLAQGLPPEKVLSIPNGVDLRRFENAQREWSKRANHIVMCARFSAQKDHATAIRALSELANSGTYTRLIFAGAGKISYQRRAQNLAKELGVAHLIDFLGNHGDLPTLLSANRFFLLSTHYEGMPLALIEGMAAGCAVVASDVIGVKEVIEDGVTGLLSPENDVTGLASRLKRLLEQPELAYSIAQNGQAIAMSRFGVATMLSGYRALLLPSPPHANGRHD